MKILNPSPDSEEILKTVFEKGVKMGQLMNQPKRGRWIHDGSIWANRWLCDCGYKLFDRPTPFCPNCGSRNEVNENDERNGK